MTELVRNTILGFTPSTSPDVVSYGLYMVTNDLPIARDPDGTVPGAQVFDLGLPVPDPADGKIRVDMEALPDVTTNDGVYNLGVVSIDDAGNESSFLIIPDVALDFIAPNAPTEGVIERP